MYKVIRFYMNHPSVTQEMDMSMDDAKSHCKDPESSSATCTSAEAVAHTAEMGPWFDGWDEE